MESVECARRFRGTWPRRLIVVSLVVVLAGCDWSLFGFDVAHTRDNANDTGISTASAPQLTRVWAATTGGAVTSSPAVVSGTVYVGSSDGKVYAFDAAGGAHCIPTCVPLWTATTGGPVGSSPAVANGIAYVGSQDHKLYALDAKTGAVQWTAVTGGPITSSPTVTATRIFVGDGDGSLYAFDLSGKLAWKTRPVGAITSSSAAVTSTAEYVGSTDGTLYAFDPSGRRLWSAATGGAIYSSPAVSANKVYVGSSDSKLYAFDAGGSTGCSGTPRVCTPLWTATTGAAIWGSPAVTATTVLVGSFDAHLDAYDTNGSQLWSAPTGGPINASPAIANGVAYIGALDGLLYAFDVTNGHLLLSETEPGPMASSPAVANGLVYVGNQADSLTADHAVINPLDPSLSGAVLTPNFLDTYGITTNSGTDTVAAPSSNLYANSRIVWWDPTTGTQADEQSCGQWTATNDFHQEGAALRVTTTNGITKAVTVTKNIFGGPQDPSNYAWFNVHTWDTSTANIATLIAQFDMRSVFDPGGQLVPLPWNLCARVVGNVLSLIAWPSTQPQPAWDDTTHGGSVTLPDGWDYAGHAGWYAGHLLPGGTSTYTNLAAGSAAQASPQHEGANAVPAATQHRVPTSIPNLP